MGQILVPSFGEDGCKNRDDGAMALPQRSSVATYA